MKDTMEKSEKKMFFNYVKLNKNIQVNNLF